MKLIRDKIPEIIEKDGKKAIIHIAENEEYFQQLKTKLQEEVNEFLEEDDIEELADILEVVYSLTEFHGVSIESLEKKRKAKAEEKGRYEKKIILDKVEE